jgi:cob(I)alamin adenosyltransferase
LLPDELKDNILNIILNLFRLSANIAEAPKFKDLDLSSTTLELESLIDNLTNQLPPLTNFIYPAGSSTIANIHITRAVCRRVERSLLNIDIKLNQSYLCYINRLSDFLFTLARFIAHTSNTAEIIVNF